MKVFFFDSDGVRCFKWGNHKGQVFTLILLGFNIFDFIFQIDDL